jgi:hypothetical protein
LVAILLSHPIEVAVVKAATLSHILVLIETDLWLLVTALDAGSSTACAVNCWVLLVLLGLIVSLSWVLQGTIWVLGLSFKCLFAILFPYLVRVGWFCLVDSRPIILDHHVVVDVHLVIYIAQ